MYEKLDNSDDTNTTYLAKTKKIELSAVITLNVYISTIQTIHRLTATKLTNSASNNIPTVIWKRTKTH